MRDWLRLSSADDNACVDAIVAAVGERLKVSPAAIRGRSRQRRIVWARHVAMWLCLLDGTRSTVEVGAYFRRDHTSVMHARNNIDGLTARKSEDAAVTFRRTAAELADALKIKRGFPTASPVDEMSPVKQTHDSQDVSNLPVGL